MQNNLLSLTSNEEEYSLVKCFAGVDRINQLSIEEQAGIIDLVGWWMINIGVTNSISDQEIRICSEFIIDEYGFLTSEEIKKAVNLSLKGKLDCKIDIYQNETFSPRYISRILEAYLDYKKVELNLFWKKKEQEEYKAIINTKASLEQQMQITIDYFKSCYNDFLENNNNIAYLHPCYDFLKKTGRHKITKKEQEDAIKKAKVSVDEFLDKNYKDKLGNLLNNHSNFDRNQLEIKYAKNHIVVDFFNKVNFDEFLASITIKDFE